jgi:hypothetical protein
MTDIMTDPTEVKLPPPELGDRTPYGYSAEQVRECVRLAVAEDRKKRLGVLNPDTSMVVMNPAPNASPPRGVVVEMINETPIPARIDRDGWIGNLQDQVNLLEKQLAEATSAKDVAYLERNQVVAALANLFPSGTARTSIEGWDPEWHGCVYIDLPTGQASWHYHDSQAYLFANLPPYKGKWDGHDTPEKYRRLAAVAEASKVPSDEELDRLEYWLSQKYKRHGEEEDEDAMKAIQRLRAENARLKKEIDMPGVAEALIRQIGRAEAAERERDELLGAAGWLAQMVIDKLGGTNDLPAWVRKSRDYYQQTYKERDELRLINATLVRAGALELNTDGR